jgi:hypothetical protein
MSDEHELIVWPTVVDSCVLGRHDWYSWPIISLSELCVTCGQCGKDEVWVLSHAAMEIVKPLDFPLDPEKTPPAIRARFERLRREDEANHTPPYEITLPTAPGVEMRLNVKKNHYDEDGALVIDEADILEISIGTIDAQKGPANG